MILLIHDFGYEDLLFDLAKRGIKIYLNAKPKKIFGRIALLNEFCSEIHDAQIIISSRKMTVAEIKM